jgi:hypothetical protein
MVRFLKVFLVERLDSRRLGDERDYSAAFCWHAGELNVVNRYERIRIVQDNLVIFMSRGSPSLPCVWVLASCQSLRMQRQTVGQASSVDIGA